MPISSLIVRTKPESTQDICEIFKTHPCISDAEIHGENVVITTETNSREEDKVLWNQIESVPGVLQCDLIYHNFEDLEEIQRGK